MKKAIALAVVASLLATAGVALARTNYRDVINLTGGWQIDEVTVDASAAELDVIPISYTIADASAEATIYLNMPHAGKVKKIWTVANGAVGTADITLTCNIGATAITSGVVTIATSGSAAGDVDSATPSALNTVTAGQPVNCVVTGGGAGGSPIVHVTVELERT